MTHKDFDVDPRTRSINRCRKIMDDYITLTGLQGDVEAEELDVRDMLTDLRHHCDRVGVDFYTQLKWSHEHYVAEVKDAASIRGED